MIHKTIDYYFFRFRFLLLYILFGVISLLIELIIARFLLSFHLPYLLAIIGGFLAGLLSAFTLNIRFNFHIAPVKRKKALLYFTIISAISFGIQFFFRQQLAKKGLNMELSRFGIAGLFSVASYMLHRKFSFSEFKKVGVAIYADGVEDIKLIYDRISNISDFIHIDIVDKTFNPNCKEVKAYRAEVVRAYWQKKKIEVHIMSKQPSVWLDDLIPYVDVIYLHPSIDEPLEALIDTINAKGCMAGIAIGINEPLEAIDHYVANNKIKHVLLLTIPQPGFSGQKFDVAALPLLDQLNHHSNRANFSVCVDGGVNASTVKLLKVEAVVSGSYVLNAPNPIKNILHLQSSGEYEKY